MRFFPKFLWLSVKQMRRPKYWAAVGGAALATYGAYHYRDQISDALRGNPALTPLTRFGREQYGTAMNMSLPQMSVYAAGLASGNNRLTGTGYAMMGAFLLERMAVGGLQFATRDRRPDPNVQQNTTGGTFPSGHSASGAAFAGVLHARHGALKALPFQAAALYTGITRIVDGAHRPHEVMAGLSLGYILGMASGDAWNQLEKESLDVALVPQWNPENHQYGVSLLVRF